jgi:uncharacterized protein
MLRALLFLISLCWVAQANARPAIAIVIDDLGADVVHTRQAVALPRAIGLAFLPYPDQTPALALEAGRADHEVIVHMPMQAMGPADPGPMALKLGLPPDEIVRRLAWSTARVPGFIGINNHEGSRFTADRKALVPVMLYLAQRHLFFFDSRTTAQTQVLAAARAAGVECAERDVFLDDVATPEGVRAQLRELERKARAQGTAIAIGHPHAATLAAVADWAAHEKDFDLVPLTVAMRLKTERALLPAPGR